MYSYIKALHIIFIVTWFAGLFYMPRLLIYNTEAGELPVAERNILRAQFGVMLKRLWLGITWPSAILTLIFGSWIWILLGSLPQWLAVKLFFVLGLYVYHYSLHILYRQQARGIFRFSSQQLRIWNEIATLFLFAIVFIAVCKNTLNWIGALCALVLLLVLLLTLIKLYKRFISRPKNKKPS